MARLMTRTFLNGYPTTDRKPMAETDWHRTLMIALIQTLEAWFAEQPLVYVSGNLLVFYVPGNKRRHVSPDVFVVKGVPKRQRPNYLIWEEGKGPDLVIELTSSSTRNEDLNKKFHLYQKTLKVREYFLFDPRGDYLKPPLRGHQLRRGKYVPIQAIRGRLPSRVLGLHLEPKGDTLRLFDPKTGQWLPTPEERAVRAEAERDRERMAHRQEQLARQQAEAKLARLRDEMRRFRPPRA
jgi:Uma2 family endonuclease